MSTHSISTHSLSASPDVTWGIQVELGPCRVVKDGSNNSFTTFTFRFRIAQTVHEFTSRYSKLYKFHESLQKSEKFQKAFNYDPPRFPPKSYWTDFTKAKNYKKRAQKLLKWFQDLLSKPAILRDPIFQKGIYLQKDLQMKMSQIAIDLQSRKRVIDIYDKNNYKQNNYNYNYNYNYKKQDIQKVNIKKIIIQQKQDDDNEDKNIKKKNNNNSNNSNHNDNEDNDNDNNNDNDNYNEDNINDIILNDNYEKHFLFSLLQEAENKMIFCDDMLQEEHINDIAMSEGNYDREKLNNMYIFDICHVLPSSLPYTMHINNYDKNTRNINKYLLQTISIDYLKHIDNLKFEIRDLILSHCDVIND